MSDMNKNGSENSIEKVAALVDEYLLACALEGRKEDVDMKNDLLWDAMAILEPKYEKASQGGQDQYCKIREALFTEELKDYLFELDSRHGEKLYMCIDTAGRGFKWVMVALVLGWISGVIFHRTVDPALPSLIMGLQVLAAGILLGATLSLVGREIESWGGQTLPEKIDDLLYRILYITGTYLLVLSLSWPVLNR